MSSYPNQKLYTIHKKIEEGDIFIMLRWEEYCAAAKELSPSALNLYMYLAKNKNGYEFFFSSKDYCQTFNVVDKTYRNAKAELINKGYLREDEKNKVQFSSSAAFKETKESLQEELKRLTGILKVQDESVYNDFLDKVAETKLKEIENEGVYKNEIKKLICFAEDLLKEFAKKDIADLLQGGILIGRL